MLWKFSIWFKYSKIKNNEKISYIILQNIVSKCFVLVNYWLSIIHFFYTIVLIFMKNTKISWISIKCWACIIILWVTVVNELDIFCCYQFQYVDFDYSRNFENNIDLKCRSTISNAENVGNNKFYITYFLLFG